MKKDHTTGAIQLKLLSGVGFLFRLYHLYIIYINIWAHFCFNRGIISYDRFISNMSLLQLMNVFYVFRSSVHSMLIYCFFCKASGRAKPPGIRPGGNGSLCWGLSCLLPSEDHLFRIAVFFSVLFVVVWEAVGAVVIFVHLLPSFCSRRTLCIYMCSAFLCTNMILRAINFSSA